MKIKNMAFLSKRTFDFSVFLYTIDVEKSSMSTVSSGGKKKTKNTTTLFLNEFDHSQFLIQGNCDFFT